MNLESQLRLSIAHEQTKHLTHEEKVRLSSMLAAEVADSERPRLHLKAFELVSWASARLGAAVNEMDALAEERADRRFAGVEADSEAEDGN